MKTEIELVLVRHGRIAGYPMYPRDNDELSSLGREQAARAAEALTHTTLATTLVCSPLRRARETADIIGQRLELTPLIVNDLAEMHQREFRPIFWVTLAERAPLVRLALRRRTALPPATRWPFIARVSGAVLPLIDRQSDGRVVAVAHGGVIWGVLTHFFPTQRAQFTKSRQVANGSITRIVIAPDGVRLIALNETTHLSGVVTY